ncbi:ABC transporter A, ABCA [Kipferlia bialata]|uniref:ABC transporter A, ABCA n=1 Tax=Kipferlia bialata TaxID=797122 RepID=A0A9K3CML4_9EUKA|nr:ABC transporter A, ABCA [Kipferlia bialata]|eukprot:g493.t1
MYIRVFCPIPEREREREMPRSVVKKATDAIRPRGFFYEQFCGLTMLHFLSAVKESTMLFITRFLVPMAIVLVLWQWPNIVLSTLDPNNHPVAKAVPPVPSCAVFDGSDGHGPGVPQPDSGCVSLAFAPANNLAVNRTMDAVIADFGWEDESIMVFDSGWELDRYANNNPGVIWLGVSFAGLTDLETLPSNVEYTIHYNQTVLDDAYLYMQDGLDPLAEEYGTVQWSGFTLYAQHAIEKAIVYEQSGTIFDPLVKGYPSRGVADTFLVPDPLTSAVLLTMVVAYQIFMVAQSAVVEKRQGKLTALRVMGVRDPLYWLSWSLVQMIVYTLTLVPFLYLLHSIPDCDIFGYVDVEVTFTIFFIFGFAATSIGLLVGCVTSGIIGAMIACLLVTIIGIMCPMIGHMYGDLLFYDPSFIPSGLQTVLFNVFPFVPFAVALSAVYIVVFPTLRIDMKTYETILVPPTERFTFSMLFGSDLYQYDGYKCLGTGCVYNTPPVSSALINMLVNSVVWLLVTWVVGEWMPSNGSPGRNPFQLLKRSYWSETVPAEKRDKHKRVPLPYNEAAGTADRLEPLDSDVRQEMVSVLTHPALDKAVVVAHSLDKTFQSGKREYNKAVNGVTLRIKQGQTFCLLGHNGAGKSTTIDMLTGTLKPDNPVSSRLGKAWISGHALNKHPLQIRRTLGICPQGNTTIWPSLSPIQHMWIVCMIKGIPKRCIKAMAHELLGYVDLLDVKNKPAGQFSGGMLRRLCIAMAFSGCPKLVILDEPSTGLDPIARHTVWTAVEAITGQKQQMPTYGRHGHLRRKWAPPPAVMLTSHDMPEAERLGDVVAIMSKGQIAALGTVLHLKAKFGTGFVISVVADSASHTSVIASAVRRTCESMSIEYMDTTEGGTPTVGEEEGEGARGTLTEALATDPEAPTHTLTLLDHSAQSLTYSVSQDTESKLPDLLSVLESREGMGFEYIEDISCTQTSLEEVFINVGHRAMAESHKRSLANMHIEEGGDESRRAIQKREVLAWGGSEGSEEWIGSSVGATPTQKETETGSYVGEGDGTDTGTISQRESRRARRKRERAQGEAKIDVLNPPLNTPRYIRGLMSKLYAVDSSRRCGFLGIFVLPFLCFMFSYLMVAHLFPFMVGLVDEYVAGYIEEAEAACQLCMLSDYVSDTTYPTEPCTGYDMLGNPYVCTLLDQYQGNVQYQAATVFGDNSPSMKRYGVPVSMTVFDNTRYPLDKMSDVSIMTQEERDVYDPWVELAQLVEAENALLPQDINGVPIDTRSHHGSLPPSESLVIKQLAPTYSNEREHVPNAMEYTLLQGEVSNIYTSAALPDPYLPGVKGLVAQYPAAIAERYANNSTYDHYIDTAATIVGRDHPQYHDAWTFENYIMYQLRRGYTWASSAANYIEEPEAILPPLRTLYARVPLMTLYLNDPPESTVQQPTLQTFMPPMTGVLPYMRLKLRMSWTGIKEGSPEAYFAKSYEAIPAPPAAPRGSGLFSNPFSLPPHVSLVNDIHAKLSGAALRSATGQTRDAAGITASFQPFQYTRDYSFGVLVETMALFTAVIFVSIAILSVLPVLAFQPVMERELKLFSLLQLKGMPAHLYWLTLLAYDMLLCGAMTVALYVTGHIFSIDAMTRMSFGALAIVLGSLYFNIVCFSMLASAFLPNTKVSSVLLNAFYSCTAIVTVICFSVYDPVTLWHAYVPPMLCVALVGKMTFRGYNVDTLLVSPLMPLLEEAVKVGALYLVLAVYFDAVIPKKGTLGVRRSVFYPIISLLDVLFRMVRFAVSPLFRLRKAGKGEGVEGIVTAPYAVIQDTAGPSAMVESPADTDYAHERERERVVRSAQLVDGVRQLSPNPVETEDEETSMLPTAMAVRGGQVDNSALKREEFAGLAATPLPTASVESETERDSASGQRESESVDTTDVTYVTATGDSHAESATPTFIVNQSVSEGLTLAMMSSVRDQEGSVQGVETEGEREARQPNENQDDGVLEVPTLQGHLPPIAEYGAPVPSLPTVDPGTEVTTSVADKTGVRRGRAIRLSIPLLPVPCRRPRRHNVRDTVMRHDEVDTDVMEERKEVALCTRDQHPLIVTNLQKYYPPRFVAVRDVCFYVENNTAMALLGPNGAGKTTTIRAVTGLTAPTRGTAFVSGDNVARRPGSVQKHLGLCPQHDVYFPSLTVRQHFSLFCRIRGVQRKMEHSVVEGLVKFLDLSPAIDRRADALSGGMRRRLSLGIAMIGSPSVLILDEPSTGLDPMTRRSVWKTIDKAKEHRVLLLTTHNMEEADALSQKIGVMVAGQMQAIGSRFHLKARYGSGYLISVKHAPSNGTQVQNRLFLVNSHIVNTASQQTPVSALKSEGIAHEYGLVFSSLEGAFLNVVEGAVEMTSAGTVEDSDVSVSEWGRGRTGRRPLEDEASAPASSFLVTQ